MSGPDARDRGVVRLGLVQSACTGDREANIRQALAGIAAAAHLLRSAELRADVAMGFNSVGPIGPAERAL